MSLRSLITQVFKRDQVKIVSLFLDSDQSFPVENALSFSIENLMPIGDGSKMYVGYGDAPFVPIDNGASRAFNSSNVVYNEEIRVRFVKVVDGVEQPKEENNYALVTITQRINCETV